MHIESWLTTRKENCFCVQQSLLITCRTIIHVEKDHGKEESEEGKESKARAIVLDI